MKIRTRHSQLRTALSAWVCAVLLVVGAGGWAQNLDAFREDAAARASAVEVAEASLEDVEIRLAAQASIIDALKGTMNGVFDVYELRQTLQASQEMATHLVTLENRLRSAQAEAAEAQRTLAEALRARVAALNIALRTSAGDRLEIVAELNAINAELSALSVPLPAFTPTPIDAIVHGSFDTPEEMYDAAAELSDAAARLERQLEELRQRLDDAEAQARVRRATGEFALEESLMDDDGGRAGRSGRVGRENAVVGADSSDGEAGSPTVSEPTRGGDGGDGGGMPTEMPGDFAGAPDDGQGQGLEDDHDVVIEMDALTPPGDRVEAFNGGRANADETLLGDDGVVADGPSMFGSVGELREHEAALLRELDAIRAERARLTERAEEMEREK